MFPSTAGMSLTKHAMGGNNNVIYKLFPPRYSLVSDILARDGNIEKLFFDGVRSIPYITFIRLHLPKSLFISPSLVGQHEKTSLGAEPRIELGPALQQAVALYQLSYAAPRMLILHHCKNL
jgi:hypothetical protein